MKTNTQPAARPMKKSRFLAGLILSTCGVATMLMVAAGTLQNLGINGRLSLPVVGLCIIVGLMLLGGGFGIMATSAATFDDHEFDRLMEAGNLPNSIPLDSSCKYETLLDTNADERIIDDLLPTPESQVDVMKLRRGNSAESGHVRCKEPAPDPNSALQPTA